jgi:hypothetical protein
VTARCCGLFKKVIDYQRHAQQFHMRFLPAGRIIKICSSDGSKRKILSTARTGIHLLALFCYPQSITAKTWLTAHES